MKTLIPFLLPLLFHLGNSAEILGYFISPSISHQAVYQKIWKELSLRGHRVTVITPNALNDTSLTNLTEVDVSHSYHLYVLPMEKHSVVGFWKILTRKVFRVILDDQLQNPKVRSLLNANSKKFDLVLVEMLYPVINALSVKFKCPYVGIFSASGVFSIEAAVGNPSHPILYPDITTGIAYPKTFWDRLYAVYISLGLKWNYYYELMPEMDMKAREVFGNDIPYLGDIESNVSLVMTTSNFIASKPKPRVPALIELGNVHLKKNESLPKDLQRELDEAKQGAVYFNLGSNIKSANMGTELRKTIISTFKELPFKVLWKWEADDLPERPDNVVIRKWFPQEAVLAHRHVVLFITQGGLQSMEEAIYYRKPLIAMPWCGDQGHNVAMMLEKGMGLSIDKDNVTSEELKSKIFEVINNDKYRRKMTELAKINFDQPISGLDLAVWWIEYVIRHKGAKNLRSPLLDVSLYEYLLLDVIAFLLLILVGASVILYVLFKYIKFLLIELFKTSTKKLKCL